VTHYLIEVALWILLAYVVGCLIGYLLRRMFGSNAQPAVATPLAQYEAPNVKPPEAATPALEAVVATPAAEVVEPEPVMPVMTRMERPRGLEAPRDGKPDDLQRISGIGPKNEKILHTLGFFHFEQIANWTEQHVAWVDDHLKFNGRIGRERWIEQSQLLVSGAEEEFEEKFGSKRPAKQS
jgi:NADH-quinone oxidoreductase subunit E